VNIDNAKGIQHVFLDSASIYYYNQNNNKRQGVCTKTTWVLRHTNKEMYIPATWEVNRKNSPCAGVLSAAVGIISLFRCNWDMEMKRRDGYEQVPTNVPI
jgi:hypothetical protein